MTKKKAIPKKKEIYTIEAANVPGSSGFVWTLHKDGDHIVTGAHPCETKELAMVAAEEFLKSI